MKLKPLTEVSYGGGRTPDIFVLFDLRTRKYLSGIMFGPISDEKEIKIFTTHEKASEYLNENRKRISNLVSGEHKHRATQNVASYPEEYQKALSRLQSVKVVRLVGNVV